MLTELKNSLLKEKITYEETQKVITDLLKEIRAYSIEMYRNSYDQRLLQLETIELLSFISVETVGYGRNKLQMNESYLSHKIYGDDFYVNAIREALRILARFSLVSVDKSRRHNRGNKLVVSDIPDIYLNPFIKDIVLHQTTIERRQEFACHCAAVAESRIDGEQGIKATYKYGDSENNNNILALISTKIGSYDFILTV